MMTIDAAVADHIDATLDRDYNNTTELYGAIAVLHAELCVFRTGYTHHNEKDTRMNELELRPADMRRGCSLLAHAAAGHREGVDALLEEAGKASAAPPS